MWVTYIDDPGPGETYFGKPVTDLFYSKTKMLIYDVVKKFSETQFTGLDVHLS